MIFPTSRLAVPNLSQKVSRAWRYLRTPSSNLGNRALSSAGRASFVERGEKERRAAEMAEGGKTAHAEGAMPNFRVLFCGEKHFPAAFLLTRENLKPGLHVHTVSPTLSTVTPRTRNSSSGDTTLHLIRYLDIDFSEGCMWDAHILKTVVKERKKYWFAKVSPRQVETFPEDEIVNRIHEYDMCVSKTVRLNSDTISRGKRLKVITQFGMGLDGIDIEAATRMGIKVGRIPSMGTGMAKACAEHAVYLMLALLRDQKGMERSLLEKRLGEPLGQTLFNKTVFIVGYGNIGEELAPRLKPFGVRILAIRPSWSNKYPRKGSGDGTGSPTVIGDGDVDYLIDQKGGMEHLHDFNGEADIVVLCCSLTPKSKGMVNRSFLASMKRGARLVNVGRGGLMDYSAVSEALSSGHLGGLGTDVTWVEPMDPHDPILKHSNVLITPHVAGVSEMSYRAMGEIIATAAVQLSEGKTVTDLEFVN